MPGWRQLHRSRFAHAIAVNRHLMQHVGPSLISSILCPCRFVVSVPQERRPKPSEISTVG